VKSVSERNTVFVEDVSIPIHYVNSGTHQTDGLTF